MDTSTRVVGAIAIVVVVIVMLAMTTVVIETVESTLPQGNYASAPVNETWNFTGASGAESILGLVPFVWIASVLIAAAVGMFTLSKAS